MDPKWRTVAPVAALVAAALLAGCTASEGPAPAAPAPAAELIVDPDRPDTTFTEVRPMGAVGPDPNATLDRPPGLVPGEWWTFSFESPFTAEAYSMALVVGARSDDGYLFGLPHEGWAKEAVAYHSPGLGDVAHDLSYLIHNERFHPVQFPLTPDAEWQTTWIGTPLLGRVLAIEGTRVEIGFFHAPDDGPASAVTPLLGMDDDGPMLILVYDAAHHFIVEFRSGLATWTMDQHGYGFQGWVTIPRGQETVMDVGRLGPVTQERPMPHSTVPVEGGYNRLTIMHVVTAIGAGQFRVTSTAPDGTPFSTEWTGGPTQIVAIHEARDPDGSWGHEEWVAGAGAVYTMGIAYHQFDIRLPDGERRSDHSHAVIR